MVHNLVRFNLSKVRLLLSENDVDRIPNNQSPMLLYVVSRKVRSEYVFGESTDFP
jgi:hypothetical protein